MSLTRRRLFQQLGAFSSAPLSAEWIAARGREDAIATGTAALGQTAPAAGPRPIRIASNENPLGPGQHVLDVISGKFSEFYRYPFNAQQREPALVDALAKTFGVSPDQVSLGCGSGEILVNAVRAFCSASKPLATAWPTFESPRETATKMGVPVRAVDLDANLRIDIDKLVEASKGAGMVFFCNPNNPTATVHGGTAVADFIRRVRSSSPDTVILVDEAYHEYATDSSYRSAIDEARSTPNVFITRTFSKAYGMAGLRVGYAIGSKEVMAELNRYRMPFALSVPTIGAALAALPNQAHIEQEKKRNTEVRDFTARAFEQMGFQSTPSNTNFIFVDLKRPAAAFRDGCRQAGVLVGRDFPPYEKTHCRVSIGTMAEMQQAVEVFKKVLGATTTTAQVGR